MSKGTKSRHASRTCLRVHASQKSRCQMPNARCQMLGARCKARHTTRTPIHSRERNGWTIEQTNASQMHRQCPLIITPHVVESGCWTVYRTASGKERLDFGCRALAALFIIKVV